MSAGDADGLEVQAGVRIPESELRTEALRSGGPGGQNVNKVSSGVLLRFDIVGSTALRPDQKQLLLQRLASRVTKNGELLLKCVEHREHARNLDAARERLARILVEALHRPTPRRATKPTRGSQRRRLKAKRRQGERKAGRQERAGDEA
mgnify:CR=1 FL=1